ncbi:hypothetical protein BDR04DRAFT_1094108, partial [Suillus decipiens]
MADYDRLKTREQGSSDVDVNQVSDHCHFMRSSDYLTRPPIRIDEYWLTSRCRL